MSAAAAHLLTGLAELALTALDLAVVGLVHFDRDRPTADRAGSRGAEGLADAVRHEPGRLVSHPKGAVQLVAAHALLGRAEKEHGLQPDIEFDLGTLKHRPYGHCELLSAILALPEAGACGLTSEAVMASYDPAMGADRARGPLKALKVFAGLIRVLEMRLIEGRHG